MKKETYQQIFNRVENIPNGVCLLRMAGKLLTYMTALIYFGAVLGLCMGKEWFGMAVLLGVPAASFILVSLFRKVYNAKRPYELYDFKPLLEKDTKGKSFPSRHVFSIFVIGSSVWWFYPLAGAFVCVMGFVLAVIRVVSGVHFPKDVAAGAVVGIFCGCMIKLFFIF